MYIERRRKVHREEEKSKCFFKKEAKMAPRNILKANILTSVTFKDPVRTAQ